LGTISDGSFHARGRLWLEGYFVSDDDHGEPTADRGYPHHARDRAAGDKRRAQLLEAAITELATHGWHAASVRSVAERTGIQPSGVLYHFPSKPSLLLAALEHSDARARQVIEATTGAPDPGGAVALDGVLAVMRLYTDHPELARLSIGVAQEASVTEHPAADWARSRRAAIRDSLTQALAMPDAGLRGDLDPRAEAIRLFALIEGVISHWLSDPDALDPLDIVTDHVATLRAPGPVPD
jgi:AcrR family transcriptional regulator